MDSCTAWWKCCTRAIDAIAINNDALKTWNRVDFLAMTRGGPAIESLWMNYDPPSALHDYSYAGADFRERERIKRKKARWKARLEKLPPIERQAILEILADISGADRHF